ncbi:hypothetical protein LCGC14_1542610 [marine sediment metagenome]|uniref:Uncharacterized protein n=1 Tax=marine sediment metagenome TaxID=412755 RepID=A0A0F9ISP3_9ZZZZ
MKCPKCKYNDGVPANFYEKEDCIYSIIIILMAIGIGMMLGSVI